MHPRLRNSARRLLIPCSLLVAAGCGADDVVDRDNPADLPPVAIVDLRVDANRNGRVELDAADEDEAEDRWDVASGAVFLANLDDDDADDKSDSVDEVVNADADVRDLAPIELRAWPEAPDGTTGTVTLDAASRAHVRLFRVVGPPELAASYQALPDGTAQLTAEELRAGARFAIEARELVTSTAADAWTGYVNLSFAVADASAQQLGSDVARMRVAPLLLQYNTAPTEAVYYSEGDAMTREMARGIDAVSEHSGLAGTGLDLPGGWADWDPWTQDFFDVGYTSMPGPDGAPIGMKIALRSAQADRRSGTITTAFFRGPDWGSVFVRDPDSNPNTDGYSMNSFGNWDVVPPYEGYPLGRNVWGSSTTADESPDPIFADFVRAQRVQPEILVDTSWLIVGHVDEVLSWSQTNTPRGWGVFVGDASLARDMLLDLQSQGHGDAMLFVGKNWLGFDGQETPAAISIDDALADAADLMAASQEAQIRTDEMHQVVQDEIGLADEEFTKIPFLSENMAGWGLIAWQPGTVNMLHVDGSVLVPKPFGPDIGGVDPFEADLQSRLGALGLQVNFSDNWDLYHRNMGEVHCGSNVTRRMDLRWWESGR